MEVPSKAENNPPCELCVQVTASQVQTTTQFKYYTVPRLVSLVAATEAFDRIELSVQNGLVNHALWPDSTDVFG